MANIKERTLKISAILLMVILTASCAYANNSPISGIAGNIQPTRETNISINDELILIDYVDNKWQVEVFFDFFNPGSGKTLDLAFISPIRISDAVFDRTKVQTYINDNFPKFAIYSETSQIAIVKNEIIPDTDQEGEHHGEAYFLFRAFFKTGHTMIHHSYSCYGFEISPSISAFSYKLGSGNNWAGPIKHIRILAKVENQYVVKPDGIFHPIGAYKEVAREGIFIRDGYLSMEANNYRPPESFQIEFLTSEWHKGNHEQISPPYDYQEPMLVDPDNHYAGTYPRALDQYYGGFTISELQHERIQDIIKQAHYPPITKEYAQLLINAIYAYHGLSFQSRELREYFTGFAWYVPDENIRINLSRMEVVNIEYLKRLL